MSLSVQVPILTRVQVPSPLLSNSKPSDGFRSVGTVGAEVFSELDEEPVLSFVELLDVFALSLLLLLLLSAVLCSTTEDCEDTELSDPVSSVSLFEQAVEVKSTAAKSITDVIFFMSKFPLKQLRLISLP